MRIMATTFSVFCLIIPLLSLKVIASRESSGLCPSFSATFTSFAEQTIDGPSVLYPDPELVFLKKSINFRENTVQHVFEDAFKFFNDTYGLDFSLSSANDNMEYFFENATLNPFRFPDNVRYQLPNNNWIMTGSTHFTCSDVNVGGVSVTFRGDQLLRGSYGGKDGVPVTQGNSLLYGFSIYEVCDQSPVIFQIQSAMPLRQEPVDGTFFINFDVYSSVLGRGNAHGTYRVTPDRENPGKFHLVSRNVFTFPGN